MWKNADNITYKRGSETQKGFLELLEELKQYRLFTFKPQICLFPFYCFQSPPVQAAAAEALAVMSESLSSRDKIGKLGMCRIFINNGKMKWHKSVDVHLKKI